MSARLCEDNHYCPPCQDGGPCVDLFQDPVCGMVACATDAHPPAGDTDRVPESVLARFGAPFLLPGTVTP